MKKIMTSIFISFVSIILMTMCATASIKDVKSIKIESLSESSYKGYYYPVADFKESKVYHYKPIEEDIDHLFWVISRIKERGEVFLTTDSYAMDSIGNIKLVEIIKEEINETGAVVKQYTEIEYDEYGNQFEVQAKMNNEFAFKWNLKENDPIVWDFKTESKIYHGYEITTERIRNYTGQEIKIEFNDKNYNAITFLDSFSINYYNSSLDDKLEFDFTQISCYAEGIGMYQYVRDLPNKKITYVLTEIISIEQWKKLKTRK